MRQRLIVPIVEGHGEVEAIPVLLHRIADLLGQRGGLRVNPPIRVKSGSFLHPAHPDFARYVDLAVAKAGQGSGLVLILLDCEDDCPARLGPDLLARARAVRGDGSFLVALAHREFETWFLAAARSLREAGAVEDGTEPPPDPESIRDAKGWLTHHMPFPYDPVVHQASFARRFDMQQARSVPSFDRLFHRLERFLADPARIG